MTDRELLELAAKAAGIAVVWDKWLNRNEWLVHYNTGDFAPWNPLTNDGDALRLAVKLCIQISIYKENQTAWAHTQTLLGYGSTGHASYQASELISEPFLDDPWAATRRAIVRAAAEIGRSIK